MSSANAAPSRGTSTPATTVAADGFFHLAGVLREVLVHLLVGEVQVAQDAFVERLRLPFIVSDAPVQERLEHRRAEQRVLARLRRPAHLTPAAERRPPSAGSLAAAPWTFREGSRSRPEAGCASSGAGRSAG